MAKFNAKREAINRRNGQDNLNAEEFAEFAYSPSFNTVGIRHETSQEYRIFNIYYPHYTNHTQTRTVINDWVSVGISYSIGEHGQRRFF